MLGCPISPPLATSCVRLELRPLPSAGITRLRRYSKPLRHPTAPSLSVTGVRLAIADHAAGLPVLRALSLCTCCRHYPGTATGGTASLIPTRGISLPCKGRQVGLCIDLFEACSAFTRVTACTLAQPPNRGSLYPKASDISSPPCLLRLLPAGAFAGWDSHPLENAALSRRTPSAVLRRIGLIVSHAAQAVFGAGLSR